MLKKESLVKNYTLLYIILVMFSTKILAQNTQLTAKSVEVTPDKRTTTRTVEKVINKKRWELTLKNDEVTQVKIAGKILGKAYYAKHQAEIDELKVTAYDMQTSSGEVGQEVFKLSEYKNSSAPMSEEEKTASRMIEEALVQDGLIKDAAAYKLVLTEKAMTLNGNILPKTTHEKFVNIYYTYSGEKACEGCHFKMSTNKAK
jgi:hypothetical protein